MRQAHFTTDDSLVKAGHRFLASVLASYDFDLLRRDDDPDPLDEFRRYEDEEQTEALLTLAAIARISDDELETLGTAKAAFPDGVGYLEQHGARTTLSIREACNKIIHAEKVWYDLAWSSQNPLWAMWYVAQGLEVSGKFKAPALMLEGTHSGSPGPLGWSSYRSRLRRRCGTLANGTSAAESEATPNMELQRTTTLPRFARAGIRR